MGNEYKIQSSKIIVANDDNTTPIPLFDRFDSTVKLQGTARQADYLDILFATYGQSVKGNIKVKVMLPTRTYEYSIDTSVILDNEYLRFDFENVEDFGEFRVILTPEYSGSSHLALWSNSKNLCFRVGYKVGETVSVDSSSVISIVTPVYKPNFEFLKEAIKSVENQSFPNWELCLVDDGSEDEVLTSYLEKLASDNSRIKYLKSEKNLNISGATNLALNNLVSGDFYCTLDQDDTIHPHALLKIAQAIDNNPDVLYIYTDEDKIDENGSHSSEFRKPGWSPTLLTNQMYTCHLSAFKTDRVKELGGYRSKFDGAQDYDMVLRHTKGLSDKEVSHIPEILYHWRVHPGSTSGGLAAKPMSRLNSIKAISEHTAQRAVSGRFEGLFEVVKDRVEGNADSVSIVIPTKNQLDILKTCLHSISMSSYKKVEIILVDNGSNGECLEFYKTFDNSFEYKNPNHSIKVLHHNHPFNFSELCNLGTVSAKNEYILYLNNDTEVLAVDWLEQMVYHLKEGAGAVGAKLLYPNGTIQHAGVLMAVGGVAGHCHKHIPEGHPGYFGRPHTEHEVSCVTGACLMVKKSIWKEVGGWNEDLPKAFNDVDFCLKVREKGHRIVYTPHAKLYHHESISRGPDLGNDPVFNQSIAHMIKRWDAPNFKDPYFNPAFSRRSEQYQIGQ